MAFHPLKGVRNWGFWLSLDDQVLKNGERIRLRWKDGHEDEGIVSVRSYTSGSPGHESTDETYLFKVEHHGTRVQVLLQENMEATRVPHAVGEETRDG